MDIYNSIVEKYNAYMNYKPNTNEIYGPAPPIPFTYNQDIDREILLNLKSDQLYAICRTNNYTNFLCNQNFWFRKIKNDNLLLVNLPQVYANYRAYKILQYISFVLEDVNHNSKIIIKFKEPNDNINFVKWQYLLEKFSNDMVILKYENRDEDSIVINNNKPFVLENPIVTEILFHGDRGFRLRNMNAQRLTDFLFAVIYDKYIVGVEFPYFPWDI